MKKTKWFLCSLLVLVMSLAACGTTEEAETPKNSEKTQKVEGTVAPTAEATNTPAAEATSTPVAEPTSAPATEPTSAPATEPTSAPATEPTSAPVAEATATPVPTSTPTPMATATPEPMMAAGAMKAAGAELKYVAARAGIILTSKEVLDEDTGENKTVYGAIDYNGNEIIPYNYTDYFYLSDKGYLVLEKENVDYYNDYYYDDYYGDYYGDEYYYDEYYYASTIAYVYNNKGELITRIGDPLQVRISEDLMVYTYEDYGSYEFCVFDLAKNEKLMSKFFGFSSAGQIREGVFFGLDFWGDGVCCFSAENGNVKQLDYEYPFSYTLGSILEGAFMYPSGTGVNDGYAPVYFFSLAGGESNWNRYNRAGLMKEDGSEFLLFDIQELYQLIGASKDAKLEYDAVSSYNGYYSNLGKLVVVNVTENEKTMSCLLDFSKATYKTVKTDVLDANGKVDFVYEEQIVSNLAEVVVATHDMIVLNEYDCYMVKDGEDLFYINKNGEKVADYVDVCSFVDGYAAVIDEDGKAYIINRNFQKVSDGYPADTIWTAGTAFVYESGEDSGILLLPYSEDTTAPSGTTGSRFIAWEDAGLTDRVIAKEGDDMFWDLNYLLDYEMEGKGEIKLSDLWKLTEIDFSYSYNMGDLSWMSELKNVRTVYFSSSDLTNINFLKDMTNLEKLYLDYTYVEEGYGPLADLKNLKVLDLAGNEISDLSFVKTMTALEELNITRCGITDFSALSGLSNLKTLYVSGNGASNAKDIGKITSLEKLVYNAGTSDDGYYEETLNNNKLSSLTELKELKNLKELTVVACGLTDLTGLENFTGLKRLSISGNDITDFSALKNLKGLYYVNLDDTKEAITTLLDCRTLRKIELIPEDYEEYGYYGETISGGLVEKDGMILDLELENIYKILEPEKITTLVIPEGVTSIESDLFSGMTNLTSLTIPSTVTYISSWGLFEDCDKLEEIKVAEGNENYYTENGVLYHKYEYDYGYEGGIERELVAVLPNVTELVIGERINYIYDLSGAKNVTKVTILSDDIWLSQSDFSGCNKIEDFVLGENVTRYYEKDGWIYDSYDELVLIPTATKEMRIPEGVTSVDVLPASLETLYIPASVTYLNTYELEQLTNLKQIEVAEGNEEYRAADGILYEKGYYGDTESIAWVSCEIEELKIAANVDGVSNSVTRNVSKFVVDAGNTEYTTNGTVLLDQYGWMRAVAGKATEIIIPDGVTEFDGYDFEYCTNLKKLYIPSSVTYIYYDSWYTEFDNVTFVVPKDSYAEKFAKENGLTYEYQ